jgi:uncharacterized membrane protein
MMAAAGTAIAAMGTAMLVRAFRERPIDRTTSSSSAWDPVGSESAASFPASDSPSWTPTTGVGGSVAPAWETKEALGGGGGIRVEEQVVIGRPVGEVYRFWRHLPNLPRFMQHLQSVTTIGDGRRSHWIARAPLGTTVEWDAEIVNEVENRLIGWRSLDGSDVVSAGSVTFTPAADNGGTEVRVKLQYDPPAGRLGATVARWLGEEPSRQIADDLRSLKQMMEEAPGLLSERSR